MKLKFIYLLITAIGITSSVKCQKEENETTNKSKTEAEILIAKKWRIVERIGGSDVLTYPIHGLDTTYYSKNTQAKEILNFNINGILIISTPTGGGYNSWNIFKYRWAFNEDETLLGKQFLEFNGVSHDNAVMDFDYHILKLTELELKIRFQGRAGRVYRIYAPYYEN